MKGSWKWAAWVGLLAVLAVVLVIGARPTTTAQSSPAQRAAAIDASLRCPSCDGISVADSSASTAVAIRQLVASEVRAGESTSQIDAFLVGKYGQSILLKPPASGISLVVWLVPLIAVVTGLLGLSVLFWRRRQPSAPDVGDDDRALVEAALRERGEGLRGDQELVG